MVSLRHKLDVVGSQMLRFGKLGRFVLRNKSTDLLSCEMANDKKNVHIMSQRESG